MVEGNDGRWRDQSLRGIRPGPMIRPNAMFEKKVQEDTQRELCDEEMQHLGLSMSVGNIPQTLSKPSEKIGKLMRVENRFVKTENVQIVENSFFQCCANDQDAQVSQRLLKELTNLLFKYNYEIYEKQENADEQQLA